MSAVTWSKRGPAETVVAELRRRWDAIQAAMEEAGCSTLLVGGYGVLTLYGDLEYLTGYAGPVAEAAFVLHSRGRDPELVVSKASDAWRAERTSPIAVKVVGETPSRFPHQALLDEVVRAIVERTPLGDAVGVVGLVDRFSARDHAYILDRLAAYQLFEATDLLAGVKMIKTPAEIAEIETAVAIADAGLAAFAANARPGVSEWDLTGVIENTIRARGARDSLIQFGSADRPVGPPAPDGFPSNTLVTVLVELIGPSGYWVERGELFYFGSLDEESTLVGQACLEASRLSAAALLPGSRLSEIAEIIADCGARADLTVRDGIGHGIGVDHDYPTLSEAGDVPLAANMALDIHPSYWAEGELVGASLADVLRVSASGGVRLSRRTQQITRLG